MNARAEANGNQAGIAQGSFLAPILKELNSLDEIRQQKGRISENYDHDLAEFNAKWRGIKIPLIDKLGGEDGYGAGADRFVETIQQADPKQFAKDNYGIDLTDEDVKNLQDYITAVQEDMPVRYFEAKSNRPVYFNEFAGAVIPDDAPQNVVDFLENQGLDVLKYEAGNESDRLAKVRQLASERGDVRFSVGDDEAERRHKAGEKAVEALKKKGVDVVMDTNEMERVLQEAQDKAQKLFTGEKGAKAYDSRNMFADRVDNLNVAKEMERQGKDASAIKMATGWERGADGLWRYETSNYRARDGFFNQVYTDELGEKEIPLSDVLKGADELFEAYPELRNIKVRIHPMAEGIDGEFSDKNKTISLNSKYYTVPNGAKEASSVRASRETQGAKTLMHEVQHAIQYIEGFAEGGSIWTGVVKRNLTQAERDELSNRLNEIDKRLDEVLTEQEELIRGARSISIRTRRTIGS